MGNFLVWVIWLLAAGACVATGLRVITAANPFSSALSLIGNLASLAVLFLLASGEFVAAAQILVYAGAVMVMTPSNANYFRAIVVHDCWCEDCREWRKGVVAAHFDRHRGVSDLEKS